jgi:hypothetical protein
MKTKQLGLHTSLNKCLGMGIGGFIEIRIGWRDTAPEEMTMHREAAGRIVHKGRRCSGLETSIGRSLDSRKPKLSGEFLGEIPLQAVRRNSGGARYPFPGCR